jgi:endothelin-converting enzyme
MNHVDAGLGWILSRFFVEKAFSREAEQLGSQIIADIQASFISRIEDAAWLDFRVATKAIKKINNVGKKMGYPTKVSFLPTQDSHAQNLQSPDIMNPSDLQRYYRNMEVNSSSFFETELSMRHFDFELNWNALGKPVDRNKWYVLDSLI